MHGNGWDFHEFVNVAHWPRECVPSNVLSVGVEPMSCNEEMIDQFDGKLCSCTS
jgi:hypothetical protein